MVWAFKAWLAIMGVGLLAMIPMYLAAILKPAWLGLKSRWAALGMALACLVAAGVIGNIIGPVPKNDEQSSSVQAAVHAPAPVPPPTPIKTDPTVEFNTLTIGCRSSAIMIDIATVFTKPDGPDVLNERVTAKDCKWINAGTRYAVTQTAQNGIAVEIQIVDDGSKLWVPRNMLAGAAAEAPAPSMRAGVAQFDDETLLAMAEMQAMLVFADDKCTGSADPNAATAFKLVALTNPQIKMMLIKSLLVINLRAKDVGAAPLCKYIVEAYGPNGIVKKGAWRPVKR